MGVVKVKPRRPAGLYFHSCFHALYSVVHISLGSLKGNKIPYNITLSKNPISEGKLIGNGCFRKVKVIFYLYFCEQYQVEARHGKAFEGLLKRYFG